MSASATQGGHKKCSLLIKFKTVVGSDRVAPSWMVSVSASVNLSLHHKVPKFSSGTGSPGWSRKKAVKWLWWCGSGFTCLFCVSKGN